MTSKITLVASFIFLVAGTSVTDDAVAAQEKIGRLEARIAELDVQLRELRMITIDLQAKVANLSYLQQDTDMAVSQSNEFSQLNCQSRRAYATKKLNFLEAKGLKETHPDMIAVMNLIKAVNHECEF